MRMVLPAIALAISLCLVAAHLASADEDEPVPEPIYLVEMSLKTNDSTGGFSQVHYAEGYPICWWTPARDWDSTSDEMTKESFGTLVLFGQAGSAYEKPEDMPAGLWTGFWHSAAEFHLGEMEFFIYNAGPSHVRIMVKRLLPRDADIDDDEWLNNWRKTSFRGELEAPLNCPPLDSQNYMCRIEGFSEGRLVRQGEFGLLDSPSSSVYQLCGPEDEGNGLAGVWPSCLLVILPAARRDHPLAWHVDKALGGLVEPPLDIAQLGPFEMHYYYPESDKLVFSLWELAGEWSEDWEDTAALVGRATLANAQPLPEKL